MTELGTERSESAISVEDTDQSLPHAPAGAFQRATKEADMEAGGGEAKPRSLEPATVEEPDGGEKEL